MNEENVAGNLTPPPTNLIGKGKRTFDSLNDRPKIPTVVQPTPAKRARNIEGPVRGHPMQLQLISESETVGQPQSKGVTGASKGSKRSRKGGGHVVQPTTSLSSNHSCTYVFGPEPSFNTGPRDYDTYPMTEEDSANEDDLADLPQGPSDKIHEAMATERPTWLDSATTDRCPTSVRKTISIETVSSNDDTNNVSTVPMLPPALVSKTTVETPAESGLDQGQATTESSLTWPADTDLIFAPGGTQVMLTLQRLLIRTVVQDAIKDLQASLLFNNAFPDGILAITFI
ncbi:hypothetical protein BJY52DRAFT_1195598 [Lactarius psammicola]|nr:hypothetical protein BJY52DRAFT_1195598 [Lactarius psammicola]